jgi:hypothetical protein
MDLPAGSRSAVSAGGRALGAVFGAASRLRPAPKPLHPSGSISPAVLHRTGGDRPSGVPWLDEPGEDEVLVRRSRSVGLPAPAPDVFGLAVRVPTGREDYGDLLFASTGLGPLSRFVFTPTWSPHTRAMTTLLPYSTPSGPVLLSAVHRDEQTVELSWAVRTGAWQRFAFLWLGDVAPPGTDIGDAVISFDPVLNTVPGLEVYDWVRRLREPSYLTARRSRGLQD